MARILVVDDRPPVPSSVAHELACWGHTVVCVGPENAAAAVLASRDVDVLVGELRMPGMDGHALDAARSAAPGLPVIVMSALSDWPGAGASGGIAVVPNAVQRVALKAAVERAVARMD